MTGEDRAASRELWSTAAEGWAAEAEERERGPAGKAADWMLEAAAPKPGESVLELACGAGDVGLRAAEAVGPDGRVLCSDFAEPMVELVRHRASEAGLGNVEARVLDAEDPQLDERFDVVLCRLGYMLVPDPARALRTSREVLNPGGRLALAVWGAGERNPSLSLVFDAVMSTLGAPPPAPGTPGPFALGDRDRVQRLLDEVGFADVVVDEVTDVREFPSAEEWWARALEASGGPVATFVSQLAAEQVGRIRESAIAAARSYEREGELRFPAAIVVASARRPVTS